MSFEHIPEGLLKKIQGLLRLEESAKKVGSMEEAANASGKIRDILMKHNLDLFTVEQASKKKKTEIVHKLYDLEELMQSHEGTWISNLLTIVAKYNLCDVLIRGRTTERWLIGTETNIEVTWYTVAQLSNRLRLSGREAFKTYEGKEKRNTYLRGYYIGANSGIQQQLAENAAREAYNAKLAAGKRAQQEETTEAESTSLMVMSMQVSMMKDVESYMSSTFKFKPTVTRIRSTSRSGRQQGEIDGKAMSINAGIK